MTIIMKNIKIIEVKKEKVLNFEEENIGGIILPQSSHTSASIGIVYPNNSQKKHYHKREKNGVEIIFVYEGTFILSTNESESEVYDTNSNGPVYIEVPSNTVASIKNVGNNEVKFFTVFSPGFNIDELVYI